MPKKIVDFEKGIITFDMEDGGDPIVFDISKVPGPTRAKLELHGSAQKIGDSYAGAKAEADPKAFAREAAQGVVDQLYEGNWRGASGGGAGRTSILLEAFAMASGKTVADVAEVWSGLSDDDKKAAQDRPKFKIALERLKIAKAQARLEKAEKEAEAKTE